MVDLKKLILRFGKVSMIDQLSLTILSKFSIRFPALKIFFSSFAVIFILLQYFKILFFD